MPEPDDLLHDGQIDYDGVYYYSGEKHYRLREYEPEFDDPEMRYRNASVHRRPDAISSDYLTSFTVGPQQQGDVSQGILNRLWRVRVAAHSVMVSRSDKSFTGT